MSRWILDRATRHSLMPIASNSGCPKYEDKGIMHGTMRNSRGDKAKRRDDVPQAQMFNDVRSVALQYLGAYP